MRLKCQEVYKYIFIYIMDIATRDLKINVIKGAIRKNNEFVIKKLVTLEKARRENEYLKTVYEDYKQLCKYMIDEKQKQKAQMKLLVDYIDKSIVELSLTKPQLAQAQYEQNRILGKLDSITNDLEKMAESSALDADALS